MLLSPGVRLDVRGRGDIFHKDPGHASLRVIFQVHNVGSMLKPAKVDNRGSNGRGCQRTGVLTGSSRRSCDPTGAMICGRWQQRINQRRGWTHVLGTIHLLDIYYSLAGHSRFSFYSSTTHVLFINSSSTIHLLFIYYPFTMHVPFFLFM